MTIDEGPSVGLRFLISASMDDQREVSFWWYEDQMFAGEHDRVCDRTLLLALTRIEGLKEELGVTCEVTDLKTCRERDALFATFDTWWNANEGSLDWSGKSGSLTVRLPGR